eukprot:s2_g15.t3
MVCRRAGMWQTALALLSQALKLKVLPALILHNSAISACEAASEAKQALKLLASFGDCLLQSGVATYSTTISSCAKSSEWLQALLLLGQMNHVDLSENVVVCGAGISACERAAKWQHALDMIVYIRSSDLQTNEIIHGSAASACDRAGEWQPALRLFAVTSTRAVKADIVLHNAVLGSLRAGAKWKLSFEVLRNLRPASLHPTLITQTAAISTCEAAGRWEPAHLLFQDFVALRLAPDIATTNVLASSLERGRQWSRILGLLRPGTEADSITLSAAAGACEAALEPSQLRWQLLRMEVLLERLLRLQPCIDTGLASKAASLLKQWLLPESRQFHVIGAPRPRTTFEYNKLISTCRWQQDWQRALLLVTDIARESMQPTIVTFEAAISVREKAARWDWALHLLEKLETHQLLPNVITCNSVQFGCRLRALLRVGAGLEAPPRSRDGAASSRDHRLQLVHHCM